MKSDVGRSRRKRVGLALGGGAFRGIAHIGVLAVLEQAQIPVDYVAGTSAGSLVGALYCAGRSPAEMREAARNLHWWDIARPVWPARGFFSFEKLEHWLVKELGDIDIRDLKKPFSTVATDLENGKPVWFREGRLAPAVRASCSVPGVISPIEMDGRILGDGSLADTVPVDILREMGAEYVIGVDIFTSSIRSRWGALGMGFTAVEILVRRAGGGIDLADCLISPEVGAETYLRLSKAERIFALGEQAACVKIEEIRKAINLEQKDHLKI